MRDNSLDLEFYQQQLKSKGITKDQLDISRYAGLTQDELQDIVDHPAPYVDNATMAHKFRLLREFDTNVPDGMTAQKYLEQTFDQWTAIFGNTLTMGTQDEIDMLKYLETADLDKMEEIFNRVILEHIETKGSNGDFGRHRFWDDRCHSDDNDFRCFAFIAEGTIRLERFHEHDFQKMLMDAYDNEYVRDEKDLENEPER